MEFIERYYKNSNTGEFIQHTECWWCPTRFNSEKKKTMFHQFWSNPTRNTIEQGVPDLTGFVPLSKKHYDRLVAKLQRVKRKERLLNSNQ